MMRQLFRRLRRTISKPLLFALYGAIGCFVAAILGEVLLALALPSSIESPSSLPQVDIMFVLDVTGSMQEEINGVEQGIQSFAKELSSRELDSQVGLIAFGDRSIGEEPQILSFEGSAFTANSDLFSDRVGKLTQVYGGDDPESSLDGIALASRQPFRSQSTKVILLITDAPPKIPDSEMSSLTQTADLLLENKINQLHLVIQDSDRSVFERLQKSVPGEVFLLSETAAGRQNFDSLLPVLGEKIAQETIKGLQTHREFSAQSQKQLLFIISGWTGILAIGIALALIVGQNFYLRRRLLTASEAGKGLLGSLIAGLLAGFAGQLLFAPVSSFPVLVTVSRVLGWTLLGTLLGAGMSLFIPNLKMSRALLGGAIGGGIGAIGFLLASDAFGDIAGRLLGAAIIGFFIGLMIALLEQLSREAWLLIHWTPKEQTKILLGNRPIVLGTSAEAQIPLSKAQGFFPITAKMLKEGETIVMQYDKEYGKAKGMKNLRHELKDGDSRKFGQITIEVKTFINSNHTFPD